MHAALRGMVTSAARPRRAISWRSYTSFGCMSLKLQEDKYSWIFKLYTC